VIAVEVRDQQVVDLRQAGIMNRRRDPFRIPSLGARPATVDEQRLPGRRDDQRRLPAFDVNEVDLERFLGRLKQPEQRREHPGQEWQHAADATRRVSRIRKD